MLGRVLAIAMNTYREAVRARVLFGLLAAALAASAYSLVIASMSIRDEMRVVADIGSFAAVRLSGGKATDIPVIEDFQKGFDLLSFAGAVGSGDKKQLYFVTTATFDEALTAYSGVTAANSNTVFEWNGDTYVYHQNGVAGLDAGDGLIKLAGVTGLTVGKSAQAADILFAA